MSKKDLIEDIQRACLSETPETLSLQDMLVAIEQSQPESEYEKICVELCSEAGGDLRWDIHQDLNGQSEDTLEFISEAIEGDNDDETKADD